jgi:hypothetical protein
MKVEDMVVVMMMEDKGKAVMEREYLAEVMQMDQLDRGEEGMVL